MSKETKKEEKTTSLSPKLQKILDAVAELSVLELSELVKGLEEKFDVQATAMASFGPATAGATPTGETAPVVEEKTEFEVVITDGGTNKIAVIKAVREFKPELGLKEAKDLIDAPPASLGTMKTEAANDAKAKLETAGAVIELK